MPKNLFDSFSPAAAFAAKLFSAAGLDFAAMAAKGDESALKLHLESIAAGTGAKEAIEQATSKLAAELAERDTQLASLNAHLTALSAALAAKGVAIAAGDDQATITNALNSRISLLAGEELAKHGLKAFPEQQVTADPTKASAQKTELKGLAKVQAAWASHPAA